jgi:putative tryptophan/tyrosine transport system substrate-binding protein
LGKAIRRRDFLRLIAGSTAALPLVARAQQAMPTIGFLSGSSPGAVPHLLTAFHRGLGDTEFIEARNLAIDYRWADGRYDRLPALAAELVRGRVSVIVAFTQAVEGKKFDLLSKLVPTSETFAFLLNPNSPVAEEKAKEVQDTVRALARQLQVFGAGTASEIDEVFASFARQRVGALVVMADPFFDDSRRAQLVGLAARNAIPTIYGQREYAVEGGLISYGTNLAETHRQVGVYTGSRPNSSLSST